MKVLAINGGNGVICYPFKKYLIGNIEIRSIFKTPNNIQWELNFPGVQLYTKESNTIFELEKPDIIIGAPNCGHSSMLAYSRAKKLSNPEEDNSLSLFIKGVKVYEPKIFLMENLTKMLDGIPPEIWAHNFPNYVFIYHNRSCIDWGNSQKTRKRLVIIGINRKEFGGNINIILDHFTNVYRVNEPMVTSQLLKGLEDENLSIGNIREDINSQITMYSGYKISLKEAQKVWLNNPKLKRWVVYDRKFTTAPGVYRNLNNSFPSVARKSNRQFNPSGLQMSPRELARIQGVPDTFKIYMDNDKKLFSINKGRATITKTPPYEISRWFYKQLKKLESWK